MDSEQRQFSFEARDEFDQELLRRPQIDPNGRRLLQLMYTAANGGQVGDVEGFSASDPDVGTVYVVFPQQVGGRFQESLAAACDYSKSTLRRAVESLIQLGILRKVRETMNDAENKPTDVLGYALAVARMIDLAEVDQNSVKGRMMMAISRGVFADQPTEEVVNAEHSVEHSGEHRVEHRVEHSLLSSCPDPVPDPVPNKSPSFTPDHDHEGRSEGVDFIFSQEGPRLRFDDIPDAHIRTIGGFSPGGKNVSDTARIEVFTQYLRDVVATKFGQPGEAQLLLAYFRAAALRMSPGCSDSLDTPLNWIRTCWMQRHVRSPLKNKKIASAYKWAGELLKVKAAGVATPAPAASR